jgi:hypothetical protein
MNSQMVNDVALLPKAPVAARVATVESLIGPIGLFVLLDFNGKGAKLRLPLWLHTFSRTL